MSDTGENFDIVVVGSGPCGVSVGLNLQRQSPNLSSRTLVIEKEFHPRHKLCGGGLTTLSQQLLAYLDLDLVVNHVPIHEIKVRFQGKEFSLHHQNAIKVIRREEFDAALVAAARERGVEIREGVTVTGLEVTGDSVTLTTNQGKLQAKAVVAADGAKSTVRRCIGLEGPSRICRAIEILTPEDPESTPEFHDHTIVIDFSSVPRGLQGYVWDFPSSVGGEPYMNRGVFDSRVLPERPNADLKEIFREYLAEHDRDLDNYHLMGNPGRWFDPNAQFAVPHVLLAGDAAGIEPLGGDGISCALWYGDVVAAELAHTFDTGDFSFTGYRDRLLAHGLGRHMAQSTRRARFIYGRRNTLMLGAVFALLNFRARWQTRLRLGQA